MKKLAIIFISVFIFAGILATPSLASQSYQSTNTPTPTATPVPGVTWKVYSGSYPNDYDNQTFDDPLDLTYSKSLGQGGDGIIPQLDAGILCTGTNCARRNIYYHIEAQLTWEANNHDQFNQAADTFLIINIQYAPSGIYTIKLPCGHGLYGYCSYTNINGVVEAAYLYYGLNGTDKNLTITSTINRTMGDSKYPETSVTMHVVLSTDPINCEDNYIQEDDVSSGNIIATVEFPTAVAITQGTKYRLELSGGPWNSSRYDAQYSLDDGTTWHVISARPMTGSLTSTADASVECTSVMENGVMVIYFTAPSTTFKIRVNDTAGAFGNNTGSMTYRLTQVRALGGECQSQYTYDPAQNILATGDLQLTSDSGQALGAAAGSFAMSLNGRMGVVLAELAPNGWYMLKLTGTWQDSVGGPNKKSFQAKTGTTVWEDFGSSSGEGCLVTSTNVVEYYFQADGDASLTVRPKSSDGNWPNNTGSITWAIYGVSFTPRPSVCSSRYRLGEAMGSGTLDGTASNGSTLPGFTSTTMFGNGVGGEWVDPDAGNQTPVTEQRYIAIETAGGPWRNNGVQSYLIDISKDTGVTWTRLDTASFVECGYMLDKYHARVFIKISNLFDTIPDTVEEGSKRIKLRVSEGVDNNFSNNSRSIDFRWYYATNLDMLPADYNMAVNYCSGRFSHAVNALATIPINAKSSTGAYLIDMPITIQTSVYAIETTGAWQHSVGGEDHFDIQISDDSGATWSALEDYPGILCAQYVASEDYHVLGYFTPIQGKRYKVRVNDEDNTWTTNPTGTLAVAVYTATATTANAWLTCGDNFTLKTVGISVHGGDPDYNKLNILQKAIMGIADLLDMNLAKLGPLSLGHPSIEANLTQGIVLNHQFISGIAYAIQTYDGAWGTSEPYSNRDVEISVNNGQTWSDLLDAPGAICKLNMADGFVRVYFQAQSTNNTTRLRVAGDDFPHQGGWIDYIIFDTGSQQQPLYTAATVPQWAVSCTTQCTAPQLVTNTTVAGVTVTVPNVDVGAWIAYAGCRIEYFLSWCPEHTAALMGLFSYFKQHEPFGTFYEMISLLDQSRAEAQSYTFVDACSPDAVVKDGGGDPTESFMPVLNDASPWNGGQAFTEQSVGGFGDPSAEGGFEVSSTTAECWSGMQNYMGQASIGFLMFIEFTKRAFGGVFYYYIGLFFQVVVIGFGLAYFQKRWQVIAW